MSGHKRTTVSISESEYRRLHDADMRARFMDQHIPALIDEVKEENRAVVSKAVQEVQTRQSTFLALTRSMQQDIQAVEWAASRALAEQSTRLENQIEQTHSASRQALQQELERFHQQLQTEITRVMQHNQASTARFEHQFATMEEEKRRKQQLALDWAQAAAMLASFIQNNYPSELIDPAFIEELNAELGWVFTSIDQDIPEASIAAARQSFIQYSRLRIELENLTLQAALSRQAAVRGLGELAARIEASRTLPALDMDGTILDLQLDIDFWSDGRLQQLAGDISEARSHVETPASRFDFDLFRSLLESAIPAWQAELDQLVFQARLSAINSQVRINIADLIVRSLQEQGFRPQEGYYLNDDMRSGFESMLQSPDGSQIVVRVDPLAGQEGRADVHLYSLDQQDRSEEELQQRALEVSQSLQRSGLMVGILPGTALAEPSVEPAAWILPAQCELQLVEREAYVPR